MILRTISRLATAALALSILMFVMAACGSGGSETPTESLTALGTSELQGETIATQGPEFDTSMVQMAELPEGFPASFPIPDGAQVTSNVNVPGEDDFRVFIAVLLPMEDALAYYTRELPANGWSIDEQTETSRGTEVILSSSEYSGELLFIGAETGVALDVHLIPLGSGEFIPDLAVDLGDSAILGEGGSSFPTDFPIPTSFSAIELNDALRGEGYELAYTYAGMAEMAMIELNIALVSAGWEMGDMTLEGVSGAYVLPFVGADGFKGYAYITGNPGQFKMETSGTVLIALAPGTP